jgi:DNA-binding transcriptional LysR family regulator
LSELDDIRAIVEVINLGGLARAARRLGVAKSVVSRRISRLEADLGTRLLNRTTHGITPTDAGLEFKLRSERILSELAEARESVARERGEIAGRLRLSVPLSFGNRYVTPILAEWSRANPRLEIDAAYSDHMVDLLAERFDAAVRIGILKDSTLVSRHIAPIRLVIVASPDYLSRHTPPTTPGELADHECLLYSGPHDRSPWLFHAGRRRVPVLPSGRFRADSGEALLQAAEAGLGITMLPTFLVATSIKAGRLTHLLADFALQEEGLFVVRPPGVYVAAKVRGLIDLMVDKFGAKPSWDRA